MFKFRDTLQLYQMAHDPDNPDNLFCMLQDYTLDNRLSRTLMNNQILIRLGVLHPLYNDSDMMKFAIDNWFSEFDPIIKKLLDVKDGYNQLDPFKNVNWEELYGGTRNDQNVDIKNRQLAANVTTNEEITTAEDEQTEDIATVSAYDSNDYQPQNKQNGDRVQNRTTDDDTVQTTGESEDNVDRFTGDRTEQHSLRHSGKEGVENYSKMLEDARKAVQFDIYDWILDRLERAVCLGVY